MTEVTGGEAAVDTADTPEVVERDWEAEAREQGWVPEAEFKGDKKPRKFLTAEEFVERGEWADSITKKVEARYETRFKNLERVNGKTIEQLQRQHEREIADLRAERREAIKGGNVERVEEIDGKIDELKEKAAPAKSDEVVAKGDDYAPAPGSAEHAELVQGFIKANPWMIEEPDMGEYAERFSERNAAANPKIGFGANMKATLAAVRKKFPAYFADFKETTAANAHAAVDGGGSHSGPAGKPNPLDKLPAEAKQQAKADMAKFPKIYPTAEAWLKVYNG